MDRRHRLLLLVLIGLVEIILDLGGRQDGKGTIGFANGNFDVMGRHFSFESFAQGQQCLLDRIFNIHIGRPTFFEKGLGVDVILTNRRSLPMYVRAGRIDLEQGRLTGRVQTGHEDRHTKRSDTTPLRIFLHDRSGRFGHLFDILYFAVR
jgi:hypothetical protein